MVRPSATATTVPNRHLFYHIAIIVFFMNSGFRKMGHCLDTGNAVGMAAIILDRAAPQTVDWAQWPLR
jgi:hypothetical protein